jgi:hypothetical protein
MALTFEIGQEYGNDLTIKVIKRTAKFITFTSVFGESRCKISEYVKDVECIYFKSWIITANEIFDAERAAEISYDRAYNS